MVTFSHKRCIFSMKNHYESSHHLSLRINRPLSFIFSLLTQIKHPKLSEIILHLHRILFIFIFVFFISAFLSILSHTYHSPHSNPKPLHKMAGSNESNPNPQKAAFSKKSGHSKSEKSGKRQEHSEQSGQQLEQLKKKGKKRVQFKKTASRGR